MDAFIVTSNNIKIKDGWIYGKRSFLDILDWIRELYPECLVHQNRSNKSMSREWACHNFLYMCGIARDRTQDVDLDWPQPWWLALMYNIGGILVWPFID